MAHLQVNQKCLLSVKNCSFLQTITEAQIKAIFKKFALGRIAKFPEDSQIIIQFQQFDELQLLDMNFDDNKIPQLGSKAYYDVDNPVNPQKFINKILQSQVASIISHKSQQKTETFELRQEDLQDQTLKQKQLKQNQQEKIRIQNEERVRQEQLRKKEQQQRIRLAKEQQLERLKVQQQQRRKLQKQRQNKLIEEQKKMLQQKGRQQKAQQQELKRMIQQRSTQQVLKQEQQRRSKQKDKARQVRQTKQEPSVINQKVNNLEKLNNSDELQKLIEEEKKIQQPDNLMDISIKRQISKKGINLPIIHKNQEPILANIRQFSKQNIKQNIKYKASQDNKLSLSQKIINCFNELQSNKTYYENINRYSSRLPLTFITLALISWIYYIHTI